MPDVALTALGRLDGRLMSNPAARSWMLWAALEGAVAAARNAGVPVTGRSLLDWISGTEVPPRAKEGLNDPLSCTVVFFYHLAALRVAGDALGKATVRLIGRFLDDREEAEQWGGDELLLYGRIWRSLAKLTDEMEVAPSLSGVALALVKLAEACDVDREDTGLTISTADGRQMHLARGAPRVWLAALMAPALFRRAGLTDHFLPGLVPPLRFSTLSAADVEAELSELVTRFASRGLRQLDRYEQQQAELGALHAPTKRSRLHDAAELLMVFPMMTTTKLARALNVTIPGAAHLKRQMASG